MRIAFLADPLDRQYGGIHVYIKELLTALAKLDKNNEYLVIRSESKNEFMGMEEIVVPYIQIPGYRFWRLFFQLPKIMIERGVDIVVEPAHFGPFNLPKKIKRVTVIHDLTVFLYPEYHVFFSQYLQRIFLPTIIKKSDRIITNSTSTTEDLLQLFPFAKDKTTSILLGKDESFKSQKDDQVLIKYKISEPYILFVGTLEPRKNVITLIQAFNDFKSKTGLPHQLVIIGKKGWKAAPVLKVIGLSPFNRDILNLGYIKRNDLPILYSMAELFVYPSVYEGFGLPVLEAMACGTPVITTNVSSLPEVGGKAVHYFSPESVAQLSGKITELCTNPTLRTKSSQLGLLQADKFGWDKTAIKMIEIFNGM